MDREVDNQGRTLLLRLAVAGAVAAALGILWYYFWPTGQDKVLRINRANVTISQVRYAVFEDFIPLRGLVEPLISIPLETTEGGRVETVFVEDGARLKKGDPIVQLVNTALQLDVISREAQLAEQINNLRNTKIALEQIRLQYKRDLVDLDYQIAKLENLLKRKRELYAEQLVSNSDMEASEIEYRFLLRKRQVTLEAQKADDTLRTEQLRQLEETVKRLDENLGLARKSLEGLLIRAPIDGLLTALAAKPGESKKPGDRLGQVDDVSRYKLTAEVDEFYLARLKPGQLASAAELAAGQRLRIVKIYPQVKDGRFTIDLEFVGSPPADIRRGQTYQLRLALGASGRALVFDNGPFFQDSGGAYVFALDPGGSFATRRTVRLGRRNPELVEVLSGLQAGDKVIVSEYQSFGDATRIEFSSFGGGQ